jgi:hypothetical protein
MVVKHDTNFFPSIFLLSDHRANFEISQFPVNSVQSKLLK